MRSLTTSLLSVFVPSFLLTRRYVLTSRSSHLASLAGLNRSKKVIAFLFLAVLGSQNVQATTITLDFDAAPLGPIPGAFGSIVVGDFTITEAVGSLEVVVDGTEQVLRTASGTLADIDISHSGGNLVFVGGRGRSINFADVTVAKNGVDTNESWRIPLGALPGAFVQSSRHLF